MNKVKGIRGGIWRTANSQTLSEPRENLDLSDKLVVCFH